MSRLAQSSSKAPRGARRLVLASGLFVLSGLLFLITDHAIAWSRVATETSTIEALESRVKQDPEAAQALHDERERQTGRSLARRERSRWIAWTVLVAAAVFVAGGKRITLHRPAPDPGLETLVNQRFALETPTGGAKRTTAPVASPAAGEAIDLEFVDDLVDRLGRRREAAIPMLQGIQTHYRYLPDEALRRVCELTEITPAQIAGTSTFYSQFRHSPVGRHVVRVCHGTACHVAGAERITQELRRHLAIPEGQDTDADRLFTLDGVACVGCCSLAPVMMIEDETSGRLTPQTARRTLDVLVQER